MVKVKFPHLKKLGQNRQTRRIRESQNKITDVRKRAPISSSEHQTESSRV